MASPEVADEPHPFGLEASFFGAYKEVGSGSQSTHHKHVEVTATTVGPPIILHYCIQK